MTAATYPELQDVAWLHERYVERNMTSREIADDVGCFPSSVRRALRRASIDIRPAVVRTKVEIGARYGDLVVVAEAEHLGVQRAYTATCDCGATAIVRGSDLTSGNTKSCGCRRRPHGHATPVKSPTYRSWRAMLARTGSPQHRDYAYYGGRGITVCLRWLTFANFLEDMGERPEGMSLDRVDNDGDYEPCNVRWATAKQQANNRRPRTGKQ